MSHRSVAAWPPQVTVDVPDVKGRIEILKVHARNKKLADDIDLETIALRTPGFSGADLANLLNEAAILAGRRSLQSISLKEIDDAVDRIVAGLEGRLMTDGKVKSLVAYHEVGHALCATLTPGHDPVQKVTLVPRGQAKGLTWFRPNEDPTLISKQQMFARIVGALGGRAAEVRGSRPCWGFRHNPPTPPRSRSPSPDPTATGRPVCRRRSSLAMPR